MKRKEQGIGAKPFSIGPTTVLGNFPLHPVRRWRSAQLLRPPAHIGGERPKCFRLGGLTATSFLRSLVGDGQARPALEGTGRRCHAISDGHDPSIFFAFCHCVIFHCCSSITFTA